MDNDPVGELDEAFQARVKELLSRCAASGYPMVATSGLRDPFAQGKLWRQGRSTEIIERKINQLQSEQAHFLAYCIDCAGPQFGDKVTWVIPGDSWHQWGEAIDCYWNLNGQIEWSVTKLVNGVNGFRNYARLADELGLHPGGYWPDGYADWPHVQLRAESNPGKLFDLLDINARMENRFGQLESRE